MSNSTSSTEATGLTEFTNSAKPPLGIRRTSVDSRRQTQSRAGSVAVDDGELLEIGYLGKAHGLQGELKLTLHNPDGEALDCIERVVARREGLNEVFILRSLRGGSNPVLVSFEGVDSREDAERLRGTTVFAFRAELPPLEEGEYYLSDLIGATVVGPEGDVGVITDLALYPTVDSVVIETPEGKRVEQPLVEPWIESVDTAAKVVRLSSLDGLLE